MVFYAVVVFVLLFPAIPVTVALSVDSDSDSARILGNWVIWICASLVLAGETLLLWLSVDTSRQRLKPRTHVLLSIASIALFAALLTVGVVYCFRVAIQGDDALPHVWTSWAKILETVGAFVIPWLVWSVVFYRLWKDASDPITRGVAWLFRGSVLELLVAVPAHVISRRREDCCAPVVSGVGISCGIAIMLLSFGPSVLLLYKKRVERYSAKAPAVT